MTSKKQLHSDQKRENKRAQFSESTKSKSKAVPILAVLALALVGLVGYMMIGASTDKPASTTVASPNQSTGGSAMGEIRIPLADLSDRAKFFDYKTSDNKPIRFFVVKSKDGLYRAALDACEICHQAKQGYYQQGDQMVCKKCGRTFPIDLIGDVSTGCHPIGLKRTVEGEHLVIKTGELEGGGRYF